MTEDLISRLRAAIEQRQRLAEAATQGEWIDDGSIYVGHELNEIVDYVHQDEDQAHIVANQPSTVLAHCRADLRLLVWYEEAQRYADRNEAAGYEHNYGAATASVLREVVVEHLAEGYGIT